MKEADLSFYEWLAQWRWPRSYRGKFLLVAFAGTHVPLLGAVGYVLVRADPIGEAWPMLGVLLVATALGTAGTLAGLHHLLRPLPHTARALRRYADDGALPDLPTGYDDQAGHLMREAQHLIERLDRLTHFRDRLLGVVAHDLRSPATSVLLATDALDDALDDGLASAEKARELVATIRHATQRQLAFSKTLLEQMHRDTLRLNVRSETIRPRALLEDVAERNRPIAKRRNVTFAIDVAPEADALHTDPRLAGQVLQNLVANAVAFSPPGGTVTLGAAQRAENVVFEVRDEGPGMPPDEVEHLFEPFRQGDARRTASPSDEDVSGNAPGGPERVAAPTGAASKTDASGGGLGLWIARTFTHLLGGALEVDSSLGEGTSFYVLLPLRSDAAQNGSALAS